MTRTQLFDVTRPLAPNRSFDKPAIDLLDKLADHWGMPRLDNDPLTLRVAMETIEHEAIVQEAYKDSVGVWTWGVGLTAAAGIDPLAYKDKPAAMSVCLAAYVDRVRSRYLPAVLKAFDGFKLSEAQLAAALSFHWNTGAIGSAEWVKTWKAGNVAKARAEIMNWSKPASIIERREKERDLFFDGKWAQTGTALVYGVSKPSYAPNWRSGRRVNVTADLTKALAA